MLTFGNAYTQTAKEILDKSAAKIKGYTAIEVDFELTMENVEENIEEKHLGKAYMMGNKYKLDIMDVVNYFDGTTMYTYMPDVQEVTIKLPTEEDEEQFNPVTLFDIHNNDFKQKLVSNNNNTAYIELYPNLLDKNFTKIGVWIKTSDHSIQCIKSFGKDGNNLIISVKSLKQPATLPGATFFTFDSSAHPEVEVVDMR
ncbi:outer membrane lipoprotein carrier protein LolA [Porphyromonadaceae bacterium OttesenSCG-928-L07]|nr:outer membrane lipoprotein carrier protein LolA [Porphyromonadaceae bacterium OttesenSCG-928-L07]